MMIKEEEEIVFSSSLGFQTPYEGEEDERGKALLKTMEKGCCFLVNHSCFIS